MPIQVGDSASLSKTITEQDVETYADISGDRNPVHLDEEYAATTVFKKRVAHGMLSAGLISAVLGTDLPGVGTIYLGQNLKFKAPVFIGDTVTATLTVTKYREDKRITTLETTITNQDGEVVVEGEATVIAPPDN